MLCPTFPIIQLNSIFFFFFELWKATEYIIHIYRIFSVFTVCVVLNVSWWVNWTWSVKYCRWSAPSFLLTLLKPNMCNYKTGSNINIWTFVHILYSTFVSELSLYHKVRWGSFLLPWGPTIVSRRDYKSFCWLLAVFFYPFLILQGNSKNCFEISFRALRKSCFFFFSL